MNIIETRMWNILKYCVSGGGVGVLEEGQNWNQNCLLVLNDSHPAVPVIREVSPWPSQEK